jgi:predicted dehydrogenase
MSRLGIALVGYGRIAIAHLTELGRLKDRASLVAIVSRRDESAAEGQRRFGAVRRYTDYDAALSDADVDAVIICTPHHMHSDMIVRAARAGKHVLVEKPLATSVRDADTAIAAAADHRVKLMVAYNHRYLLPVMEAKRLMSAIGEPTNLVHIRGASFPLATMPAWWKAERLAGGFVIPLAGSHQIDTCLWWLGERPDRVFAEGVRHGRMAEGEDVASLSLTFPSGVLASIHLSYNAQKPITERIVVGTLGVMRVRDDRLVINDEVVVQEEVPSHGGGGASFHRQLAEFIDAIVEDREPLASGRETRATVEVLAAARRSLADGRPVTLGADVA